MTYSGTLVRVAVTALAATLLPLLSSHALASNTCKQTSVVTVTAAGASFALDQQRFADAIIAGLNQAIAQARGVFVTSRMELLDEYRSTVVDGVTSLDVDQTYHEEITSTFSGFVKRYQVLERSKLGADAVEVTLRVEVCLDARIAIGIRASGASREAIFNSIADDIHGLGWRVVPYTPSDDLNDKRLMAITLADGVTYIADGEATADFRRDRGFDVATLTSSMRLIDTRTMEAVHTVTVSETGVGGTRAAALQQAGERIGREIVRSWSQAFLRAEDRNRVTLYFEDVRRGGTRFSLQEMLERIAGVLAVLDVHYDAIYGQITIQLESTEGACELARDLVQYRRVLTQLHDCNVDSATLRVLND